MITVEFEVGEPRRDVIVRLLQPGLFAPGLGAAGTGRRPAADPADGHRRRAGDGLDPLDRRPGTQGDRARRGGAHAFEAELKRVPGTRDVSYHRAHRAGRWSSEADAARLAAYGLTVSDLVGALKAANIARQVARWSAAIGPFPYRRTPARRCR